MWRGRASTAMALATLLPSSTSCYEVQRQHSLHAQQLLSNQTAATASPAQPGSAVNLSLHGPPKGPLPEQQQQPIRIDAISSPPPPDAKITGPLDYTTAHAGFMTAIAVLLLLPVLIFIGCYVARQVRRANKRAADLRRLREEQLLREAEEAAEPVVIERRPPPAPLAPRSETPQQAVDENGQLPPVRINPAFLPVDAYHGVPRSVVL